MKNSLIWTLAWTITSLALIPCVILSALVLFRRDFHYDFNKFYYEEFMEDNLNE